MRIDAATRPFILTFPLTGSQHLLTSDDAQRLLDTQRVQVTSATRSRVTFCTHDGTRSVLEPATRGGGAAFVITR